MNNLNVIDQFMQTFITYIDSGFGLLQGDVVIQLGAVKVTEMTSYMKALGQFNKGDKSKVTVKRGTDTIVKDIEF